VVAAECAAAVAVDYALPGYPHRTADADARENLNIQFIKFN